MSVCKAKNCTSQEITNQDLTFHKFPLADSQLLQRWITNIAPQNFEPQPDDEICSLHFTDDQFLDTVPRRLTRFAVPTLLFIDNKYIPVIDENAETTTNEKNEIKDEDEISTDVSSPSSLEALSTSLSEDDSDSDFEIGSSKRKTRSSTKNKKVKRTKTSNKSNGKQKRNLRNQTPRFVGDFKESDLKSPEKMKRLWEISQNQIEDQKKKLRTYQQKNRRLESQVTRLKNIIKHLKTVHR